MARFESEREFIEGFDRRYEVVLDPLMLDIEEEVQGTRVGASSWTTRDQLDEMIAFSELEAGDVLLEVGCGTGWVGRAFAEATQALLVSSDIPFGAVSTSRSAAVGAGISHVEVAADATAIPFRDQAFAAITHSDVLCCLSAKQEALEEMRRVVRPDGVMVFAVIVADESLSPHEATERLESGAQYVVSSRPYGEMLIDAGWEAVVEDWTPAFREMSASLDLARRKRTGELVQLLGEEEALAQVERGRWNMEAIDEGAMKRRLYVARPA